MALLRSYSVRSKRSRSAPEKDDIPALPYALDLSFDLDYGAPRPLFLAPPPSPSSPAPSIMSTASKKSRWKAKLALLNPVRRFRKSSTEDDSMLASPALSVRSSFDIPPHSPVESKSSSERTFSPMTPERFRSLTPTLLERSMRTFVQRKKAPPIPRRSAIPSFGQQQIGRSPTAGPKTAGSAIAQSRSSWELDVMLETYRVFGSPLHSDTDGHLEVGPRQIPRGMPPSGSMTPLQLLHSGGYMGATLLRDESMPFGCLVNEDLRSDTSSASETLLRDESAPFDVACPDSMSSFFDSSDGSMSSEVELVEKEDAIQEGDAIDSLDFVWPLPPKRSFLIIGNTAKTWVEPEIETFGVGSEPPDKRHVITFPPHKETTHIHVSSPNTQYRSVVLTDAQLRLLRSPTLPTLPLGASWLTPKPRLANSATSSLEPMDCSTSMGRLILLRPGVREELSIRAKEGGWGALKSFWERNGETIVSCPASGRVRVEVFEAVDGAVICRMRLVSSCAVAEAPHAAVLARFDLQLPVTLADVGKRCGGSRVGEDFLT